MLREHYFREAMNSRHKLINTDDFSARLRERSINLERKLLLVTNFNKTEQEKDLSEPPNCKGFGRVRHFRRKTSEGWPSNSLPIDPACTALNLPRTDLLRTQAFQNAACNWRCWYCFVPFDLLSANRKYSEWLSAADLIDLYLDQPDPPRVIDLTGGQPDLVPEWVPWMMEEIKTRGLEHNIYLWSDDNLSNDYFWQFLSEKEIEFMAGYKNYGRVCCFKGFNTTSFSFNTLADPVLFDRQFDLFSRLASTGIDLYAYTTFTTPSHVGIKDDMDRFLDRLQEIDENLPLRTIPLEIREFTPVTGRMDEAKSAALKHQQTAIESWQEGLSSRFSVESIAQATQNIDQVPLTLGK